MCYVEHRSPNIGKIEPLDFYYRIISVEDLHKGLHKFFNMRVKVINLSKNDLPRYETELSAGMDVRADLSRVSPENPTKLFGDCEIIYPGEGHPKGMIRLDPGARALFPTGLKVALPAGYEIQVRPRSGLALEKGLTVLNTPGTIDAKVKNL